LKVVIT